MFIEVLTKRDELVTINVSDIRLITSNKNKCLIIDNDGLDYELNETYNEFIQRFSNIENIIVKRFTNCPGIK